MKQKKLRAWTVFPTKAMMILRDRPLIENLAANVITSDPCQLKLTIEESERSSRDGLGAIDTGLN